MVPARRLRRLALVTGVTLGLAVLSLPTRAQGPTESVISTPIQHIVIVDQENHSFDDMLGKFCVDQSVGSITRAGTNDPCDGTDVGVLSDGSPFPLTEEPDGGLLINHSVGPQRKAIDGGKMDRFDHIPGCRRTDTPAYGCLSQYPPTSGPCGTSGTETCIPNIVQWAESYAISDRTFEFRQTPSWAGHMVLGDATIQRFFGNNPKTKAFHLSRYPGWGCDSGRLTPWVKPDGTMVDSPPCVPDKTGSMGPLWDGTVYATSPHAKYVPTIFDRLDQAGLSWKIYSGTGGTGPDSGYFWAICPTFWECLGSSQANNLVPASRLVTDLAAGSLPAVSFVTPDSAHSMHQPSPASVGDNWLASAVIGPIMSSNAWNSTAIFLTWDDCGCFYDHVAPPWPEWGVRVPMVIISPYAKPGYTDSTSTTFVSMLAFVEHVFGLSPLNPCATVDAWDPNCTDDVVGPGGAQAYDFMGAFDFSQHPLGTTRVLHTRLSAGERAHLEAWARRADQGT